MSDFRNATMHTTAIATTLTISAIDRLAVGEVSKEVMELDGYEMVIQTRKVRKTRKKVAKAAAPRKTRKKVAKKSTGRTTRTRK